MFLPLYSSLLARLIAANKAAPAEIPTKTPSVLPKFFDVAKASSLLTVIISSITFNARIEEKYTTGC